MNLIVKPAFDFFEHLVFATLMEAMQPDQLIALAAVLVCGGALYVAHHARKRPRARRRRPQK